MSQNENYQPLGRLIISNVDLHRNNYWSPCIEKQLLEELKSPTKISVETANKKFKNKKTAIYLLIAVLASSSIGMCIQANSIAQALREVARISALQIYSK